MLWATAEEQVKAGRSMEDVMADLNGDGKADFLLRLSGHIDLDRGDFLL